MPVGVALIDWVRATDTRGSILCRPREGVVPVTAFAPDTEKLRELDEGTQRAWAAYSERLRELSGDAYERAERESWDQLQGELRRLERRRRALQRAGG
jgi:hypothetical protein